MQILSMDEKSTFLLPWQISSLSGLVKSSNSKPSLHLRVYELTSAFTEFTKFTKVYNIHLYVKAVPGTL